MIPLLFLIWRSVLFIVAYIAQHAIPYLGFFPYREILTDFKLPSLISSFANFDGLHYILISQQGYSQYEQAYFPLYPLLMALINIITCNALVSGLIISHVSFLVGLVYLHKLLVLWNPKQKNAVMWTVLFILAFPTSFFFGSIYTEGLFFMLVILTLYSIEKRSHGYAAIIAALASATRLMGVFLIVPIAFSFLQNTKSFSWRSFANVIRTHVFVILSPIVGLLAYCIYLWATVGDPLFFLNAQPAFGANRSTSIVLLPQVYFRYFKILFTAAHDFRWYISLLEMVFFTFVLGVLALDLKRLWTIAKRWSLIGINVFSFINIVLPTLTGTFSSIPRYALFSLSLFLFLGHISNSLIKKIVVFVFAILQIALLSFFVQGYFIG